MMDDITSYAINPSVIARNPHAYALVLLGLHLLQCSTCIEAVEEQDLQAITECIEESTEGQALLEENLLGSESVGMLVTHHFHLIQGSTGGPTFICSACGEKFPVSELVSHIDIGDVCMSCAEEWNDQDAERIMSHP